MAENSESSVAAMEMAEEGQSQVKYSPKLIKLQEIVENVEEDQISSLPEHLLLEILSRFPSTKEAIRTGILCKRWEHLWTLIPALEFSLFDDNRPLSDFVSFVDKTLTQCRQLKLKKLRLMTLYDNIFELQFNSWIRYAIDCNIEKLILSILSTDGKAKLVLDQKKFVSPCFTDLSLLGCVLNPNGAISWKNLRSLSIYHGKVDEELIENILSGSPVLETLVLDYCTGYKLLNITSKSVTNLILCGYRNSKGEYDDEDIIRINAPNILSLTIKDDFELWKVLLVNVCSLVEANLDYKLVNDMKRIPKEVKEGTHKGIILNLRHVKDLKIGSSFSKVVSRLETKGFEFPSNIKFPDVNSNNNSPSPYPKTPSHSCVPKERQVDDGF